MWLWVLIHCLSSPWSSKEWEIKSFWRKNIFLNNRSLLMTPTVDPLQDPRVPTLASPRVHTCPSRVTTAARGDHQYGLIRPRHLLSLRTCKTLSVGMDIRARNEGLRWFHKHGEEPTRVFSWLKVLSHLRHYAKWVFKHGKYTWNWDTNQCKDHKGQVWLA